MPGDATSLTELIQLLIELSHERAFCRVEFSLAHGQIGIVKLERHHKPGELPIRDRGRIQQLQGALARTE